jgi:hypothetical protein
MGENSPNLVTLVGRQCAFERVVFFSRSCRIRLESLGINTVALFKASERKQVPAAFFGSGGRDTLFERLWFE